MDRDTDISGALLFALFIAWLIFEPTTTIRVQSFSCEGAVDKGRCQGKLVEQSRYKFIVNMDTQTVARTATARGEDGAITSLFDTCRVVNSDNWLCKVGNTKFGFLDGAYLSRFMDGPPFFAEAGLSGFRYWLHYAGLKGLQPEWVAD